MLICLSHHLSEHTPFYVSLPKPELRQIFDLGKGDICNSFYFTTSNHAGTHVDAPRHFCAQGRSITDYALPELVFSCPAVLDVPLLDEELIGARHLEAVAAAASDDTDLVLLRSRFGRFRGDERRYVDRSPGFGPAAAEFLMERFLQLRALAVDLCRCHPRPTSPRGLRRTECCLDVNGTRTGRSCSWRMRCYRK
jgi:arylformamidase